MRHFAHHIGDYAAATAHLSFVEDAAYHRLLRLYYRDERPLPVEVAACRRLVGARTKDERTAIDAMLREFFTLKDDGWHQTRADNEIDGYQSRADTARENGQRGGRPRTRTKPSRNPSGLQNEPDEKLTNNHEPVTSNQEPVEEEVASAFALFNDATKRTGWPAAQKLDADRKKLMRARLNDVGGIEGFAIALGKVEASQFLTETWPNFNLDWMLKPKNFRKLMEGNYDKRTDAGKPKSGLTAALAGLAD